VVSLEKAIRPIRAARENLHSRRESTVLAHQSLKCKSC
jgi:hypothetical protein